MLTQCVTLGWIIQRNIAQYLKTCKINASLLSLISNNSEHPVINKIHFQYWTYSSTHFIHYVAEIKELVFRGPECSWWDGTRLSSVTLYEVESNPFFPSVIQNVACRLEDWPEKWLWCCWKKWEFAGFFHVWLWFLLIMSADGAVKLMQNVWKLQNIFNIVLLHMVYVHKVFCGKSSAVCLLKWRCRHLLHPKIFVLFRPGQNILLCTFPYYQRKLCAHASISSISSIIPLFAFHLLTSLVLGPPAVLQIYFCILFTILCNSCHAFTNLCHVYETLMKVIRSYTAPQVVTLV